MTRTAQILLLSLFFMFTCNLFAAESKQSIKVSGYVRDYLLYIPKYLETEGGKTTKVPLLMVFHGYGSSADQMESLTGFENMAEKEHFIVIYPQGIDKSWNDGRAGNNQINDVEFISNLINLSIGTYPVDPTKIFVTGISNGGFMSMRLACELGNKIAAAAAVGATIDTGIAAHCQSTFPVSVMLIHGTKDPIVSIDGGSVKRLPASYSLSHQALIARWVQRNHCNSTPSTYIIPDSNKDQTIVIKTTYTGGSNNSEVVSYVIENGGHTWPGSGEVWPEAQVGRTTRNLDASDVIWEFFKMHGR